MSEKVKFYNISKLLKTGSRFMLCYGERSNGKTFQALLYGLERYLKYGVRIAIIRRYREDFKSKRGANAWNNLISDHNGHNHIKELTKGKYEAVKYNAGQWYLAHWDTDLQRYVTEPEPFAYSFALTEWEHDKGNSYPIGTIFLDEFMSSTYLPNETVAFFQVLSTIVRDIPPTSSFPFHEPTSSVVLATCAFPAKAIRSNRMLKMNFFIECSFIG